MSLENKKNICAENTLNIPDNIIRVIIPNIETDSTYLFGTEKRFFNRKGKLNEWNSFNSLLSSEVFRKYKLNKNGSYIHDQHKNLIKKDWGYFYFLKNNHFWSPPNKGSNPVLNAYLSHISSVEHATTSFVNTFLHK